MRPIVRNLTIAVSVVLTGGIAHADALEEIVVTAQKREQGINDVGITVNAFTGEQLRDFGFTRAEDIALLTPGLTVNHTAATGVPLYTIRGVGFQDYSTAASSTVGLYYDQVAMPYTVMTRGLMFDIERVEVMKGPQGDLYGRNTTAGQINFISRKPTEDFQAGVNLGVGSYNLIDAEGFVSGPLSETVRGRIAARTVQASEGWQESLTRDDKLGEQNVSAVRGFLEFDLGDSAKLLVKGQYVDDQSDNQANTVYNGNLRDLGEFQNPYTPLEDYALPGGPNFGEVPPWYSTGDNSAADWTNSYTSPQTGRTFDLRPQRDNQLAGISALLDWEIGETTLTSITAYDDFQRVEANDWDGGFYNDSSNINTTNLTVFSQELRLTGGDDELLWIAGAYYSRDEMDEYYHYFMSDSVFGTGSIPWGVGLFAPTPIVELDTKYDQETTSAAVFGRVEWRFAERWRLTLGARYTDEERSWSGCTFIADDESLSGFLNAQFGSTLGAGDCGTIDDDPDSPTYIFAVIGGPNVNDAFHVFSDTINTERLMGKVGLDFAITDDILLYGTISNGFKSGGFNGANSNTTLQLQPYKEEVLTSYEIGTKATLLDSRMQLNVAAFFYDYRDKQEQDTAVAFVGNISGLTNVPKSEIYGGEVELQWAPTDSLDINFGISLLESEVKEWMAVDPDASAWPTVVRRDASGIELAQAPNISYNGKVTYRWNIGSDNVLDVSLDFAHKDSTSGGAQLPDATESYTVINGGIGFGASNGRWRVLAWGRNVTDEYYFPAAYVGGNGPFIRSLGMPQTFGVSLDWKFGAY